MQKRYEFVNVSEPPNVKDAEHKRTVAIKSMRAFRRHERLKRTNEYQKKKAGKSAVDSNNLSSTSPKIAATVSSLDATSPFNWFDDIALSPVTYLEVCLLEPFKTQALQLPSIEQDLLTHFAANIGPILLPTDISNPSLSWTTLWIQRALSSPPLLAATCCHASVHQDAVLRRPRSRTTLELQSKAIRLLSELLEAATSKVPDEAIGANVMLAANAVGASLQ